MKNKDFKVDVKVADQKEPEVDKQKVEIDLNDQPQDQVTSLIPGTIIKSPVRMASFHVMPGKSLTTKRGVIATEKSAKKYSEIKAEDLAGGEESLKSFVESGHIGPK